MKSIIIVVITERVVNNEHKNKFKMSRFVRVRRHIRTRSVKSNDVGGRILEMVLFKVDRFP